MKDSAEFGLNKTPTQLNPAMTQSMLEAYDEFPPHAKISPWMPSRCEKAI